MSWNEGNISHIARHGITIREVEHVCNGRHIARKEKGRCLVYGETEAGKLSAE